jgi:hypothetical protein
MSNQQTIECANPACNCTILEIIDTEAYCSDYCRDAGESEEMEFCECGHPPCDAE